MNIVLMLFGLSSVWLFMFKMEWLLNAKAFSIYIVYSLLLFVVATILQDSEQFNYVATKALKIPLISGAIFKILFLGFKTIFKKNPENTFWSLEKKPIENIIFSVLFWLLGVGLPFVFIR
jgi:hypothetical protein